jgi:hypothetical protein
VTFWLLLALAGLVGLALVVGLARSLAQPPIIDYEPSPTSSPTVRYPAAVIPGLDARGLESQVNQVLRIQLYADGAYLVGPRIDRLTNADLKHVTILRGGADGSGVDEFTCRYNDPRNVDAAVSYLVSCLSLALPAEDRDRATGFVTTQAAATAGTTGTVPLDLGDGRHLKLVSSDDAVYVTLSTG